MCLPHQRRNLISKSLKEGKRWKRERERMKKERDNRIKEKKLIND